MKKQDPITGRFIHQAIVWDYNHWDVGYIGKGRFRIYRPDYPRCDKEGYATRAHVIWWLARGEPHPKGTCLHHKNHIKLDDRLDNLEVLLHAEHTILHCRLLGIPFQCAHCGNTFYIPTWRVRQRNKEGHTIRFCSLICFNKHGRSPEHRIAISNGLLKAHHKGI